MKTALRIVLPVLILLGVLLLVSLVRTSNRRSAAHLPIIPDVQEPSNSVTVAVPEPTDELFTPKEAKVAGPGGSAPKQGVLQASLEPGILTFKPGVLTVRNRELLSLIDVASNAVMSIDRILKTRDYRIHEFNRSTWLTSEDEEQAIVWTIFPCRTNAVVGSVEAVAYQDAALKQKDPSRSFRMSLDPESGDLLGFSWADKHEVLFVQTNDGSVDYARHLGGKKRLVMRWDAQGDLIASNVYDWATRGRVIGGPSQADGTTYRLGPTSAVEAVSESWRRKVE